MRYRGKCLCAGQIQWVVMRDLWICIAEVCYCALLDSKFNIGSFLCSSFMQGSFSHQFLGDYMLQACLLAPNTTADMRMPLDGVKVPVCLRWMYVCVCPPISVWRHCVCVGWLSQDNGVDETFATCNSTRCAGEHLWSLVFDIIAYAFFMDIILLQFVISLDGHKRFWCYFIPGSSLLCRSGVVTKLNSTQCLKKVWAWTKHCFFLYGMYYMCVRVGAVCHSHPVKTNFTLGELLGIVRSLVGLQQGCRVVPVMALMRGFCA